MTHDLPDGLDAGAVLAVFSAARERAAAITLAHFREGGAVDNKAETGFDPVTEADRAAETAIREEIAKTFPDHAIVGEEWAAKATGSDFCWIVDPIDGTRAFMSGIPLWGTLIGLTHRGRAVAGMMAQPYTGESWFGMAGKTLFRRGGAEHPVRSSGVARLAEARVTATTPEMFADPALAPSWSALADRALQVRYGLDCYGYCLLASGHIDLVVEAGLKDVDIAPLVPVIEGAGGVVTTWDGGRAERGGNCLAAATPELHAQAVSILRGALG